MLSGSLARLVYHSDNTGLLVYPDCQLGLLTSWAHMLPVRHPPPGAASLAGSHRFRRPGRVSACGVALGVLPQGSLSHESPGGAPRPSAVGAAHVT